MHFLDITRRYLVSRTMSSLIFCVFSMRSDLRLSCKDIYESLQGQSKHPNQPKDGPSTCLFDWTEVYERSMSVPLTRPDLCFI